jgi:hypothetical protein
MKRLKFTRHEKALLRAATLAPEHFQQMAILVEHVWGEQDLTGMSLEELIAPLEAEGWIKTQSIRTGGKEPH